MGTGKKKIQIKRVEKEERRMVTFSKRRQGLFRKAQQLHALTGAHIAVIAFSPAGRPYTHAAAPSSSASFDALIDRYLQLEENVDKEEEEEEEEEKDLRAWLDAINQIDHNQEEDRSMEELIFLKKILEEVRGKVAQKIEEENNFGVFLSL